MFKKYSGIIAAVFFLLLGVVVLILASTVELKDNYGGAALVPRICALLIMAAAAKELIGGIVKIKKTEKAVPAKENAAAVSDETPASEANAETISDAVTTAAEAEQEDKSTPSNYMKVILTFVSIILYALLFEQIGFLPATILYITSQAIVLAPASDKTGKKRLLQYAIYLLIAVVFSFAIYLLFTKVFWIMLPTGKIW